VQFVPAARRIGVAPQEPPAAVVNAPVKAMERDHPDRQIAVLVPELVVKHWRHTPLHNQRAQLLKLLLLVRGNQRLIEINIRRYL
jgi:hypothetical protein